MASASGVILHRAARRVREEWRAHGAADRAQVEEELEFLLGWLERADGRAAGPTRYRGENPFIARRLIEALRLRILLDWQERRDDDASVDYLVALSALELLARATQPKDARDLTSRLTDPDGFELLVEAAHDLRSPLTSIGFLSETLREGHSGDINDLQRTQLGLIYSAALGMTSIVTDLVDLARRGKDLLEGPPEIFSIAEQLHDVERLLRPIAEEKDVELVVEHDAHDRVRGYPLAVSRVLLNLVTNALNSTDIGSVKVTTRQVDHETIEFAVRDTGPGMTEEERRVLFQPFRKSPTRKRGVLFSGTGLGLSIVRRLVTALDSELVLDTAPGAGASFSFRLQLPPVAHL